MGKKGEGRDQIISAVLSRKLGINHQLIPVKRASGEKASWDHLVGDCVREVNRELHPTLGGIPEEYLLTGMFGETGRARLYSKELDKINELPISARLVGGRITVPMINDEVASEMESWVASIDWAPTSVALDLAFNELRFGGWAIGQVPAQRKICLSMFPFSSHRLVQENFMLLRPSLQGETAFFTRIAEILWPESLSIGINKYGDYRDILLFLRKFTKREHLVRYLRDRLAVESEESLIAYS